MVFTGVGSDAGEESISIGSQPPEDQSECWHVIAELGEEVIIRNTFLQVVRKEFGRPYAGSTPAVLKFVCGSMCEEQIVHVLIPLGQEEFVESESEALARLSVLPIIKENVAVVIFEPHEREEERHVEQRVKIPVLAMM